jgi:SAM-dependent methyltransferase
MPVEKHLVDELNGFLGKVNANGITPYILNIGAGERLSIEKDLSRLGRDYICDRIDVDGCSVDFPTVRHSLICSVEEMSSLQSKSYSASFANFVLEHVPNLHKAAREICRVLSPSSIFVATVPNPSAPEFRLAKRTPLWFHRLMRRERGWETHYSYRSIPQLVSIFEASGFTAQDIRYWPCTETYLWRYPLVNGLSELYDHIVSAIGIRSLMGHACVVFTKSSGTTP